MNSSSTVRVFSIMLLISPDIFYLVEIVINNELYKLIIKLMRESGRNTKQQREQGYYEKKIII